MKTSKPWSESKKFNFIKGVLRKGTTRWPAKYECLNNAKCGKMVNQHTGRVAEHYRCATCSGMFPATMVVVDHVLPVVPVTGFTSWDNTIQLMFCDVSGLQVLCKPCHKLKSSKENAERREHKKLK